MRPRLAIVTTALLLSAAAGCGAPRYSRVRELGVSWRERQTASATFVDASGREVVVIGETHVASPAYWVGLGELHRGHTVLFEGVAAFDDPAPRDRAEASARLLAQLDAAGPRAVEPSPITGLVVRSAHRLCEDATSRPDPAHRDSLAAEAS